MTTWMTIREYINRYHVSLSTVHRHIQQGKVQSKKVGRNWYILGEEGVTPSIEPATLAPDFNFSPPEDEGNLKSVVEFSSKALHHYLMMSDKLVAEKDLRIKEKEAELIEKRQTIAELTAYTEL